MRFSMRVSSDESFGAVVVVWPAAVPAPMARSSRPYIALFMDEAPPKRSQQVADHTAAPPCAIVKLMHRHVVALVAVVAAASAALVAQDRLKSMPGYERVQRYARESPTAARGGNLSVTWMGSDAFEYVREGKRFHFDVASRATW